VSVLFGIGAVIAALYCAPSVKSTSKALCIAALTSWILVVSTLSLASLVALKGWP